MDCCTLQLIFVNYEIAIVIIAQAFDLIKEQDLLVCKTSFYYAISLRRIHLEFLPYNMINSEEF